VKFADADLIGWPYQIIVGKKGVTAGTVEIKTRGTGDRISVAIDEAVGYVAALVESERVRFNR
jgi:prolyl-tRNA synthetase